MIDGVTREIQMIQAKIRHTYKLIEKEKNKSKPDANLIDKYNDNIKQYEKEISKLEQ